MKMTKTQQIEVLEKQVEFLTRQLDELRALKEGQVPDGLRHTIHEDGVFRARDILKGVVQAVRDQNDAARRGAATVGEKGALYTVFNGVDMILTSLTVEFDHQILVDLAARKK